ncbi:hypothetical protein DM02DRAFT_626811 [Periconia macrospinosa]|uniref:DUF7580 domain-containing protein n=1 Tax=Periconia macrospinosa TaxID=97972 RepID=A0A2V1DWJ3_9PLEO|nr:hypothetical protein DM02DRAFT_626811 [Periconia macrospinosa]
MKATIQNFTERLDIDGEGKPSRQNRNINSTFQKLGDYAKASFKCSCQNSSEHTALLGLASYALQNLSQKDKQPKPELHVIVSVASPKTDESCGRRLVWQEVSLQPDVEHTQDPKLAAEETIVPTSVSTSNSQSSTDHVKIFSIGQLLSSPLRTATRRVLVTFLREIGSSYSIRGTAHPAQAKGFGQHYHFDKSFMKKTQDTSLASAVLQLHASPRLQSTWSNDNVVFLERGNESLYEQVYISSNILKPDKKAIEPSQLSLFNEILVALAVVLVELSLGPMEKLQIPDDLKAGVYARIVTLWRLADGNEIGTVYGPKYQGAVKRCVELAKMSSSFDEQVKQEFYAGVVSVLEDQAMRKAIVISL